MPLPRLPMRLPVSLLVLCAAISGCTSSSVSSQTDTVLIISNPTSAAVRLNGKAVGRTPTKITVDRVNNYELQVGKGGYTPESTIIKPSLRNGKAGMEFGFPESVQVTLTKIPGSDETAVPDGDLSEFRTLVRKANNLESETPESLRADIKAVQEASKKLAEILAAREAASAAKLADISKAIAEAKAAKGNDAAAEARLTEAELALKVATAEAETNRADADATLHTLEARRAALEAKTDKEGIKKLESQMEVTKGDIAKSIAASEAKIADAQAALAKASASRPSDAGANDRLAALEARYAEEVKAMKSLQENSAKVISDVSARADVLAGAAEKNSYQAEAEAAKGVAELKKALEAQKAAVVKAQKERDAAKVAAKKASDLAKKASAEQLAQLNQQLQQTKVEADKAVNEAKTEAAKAVAAATETAAADAAVKLKAAQENLAAMEKTLAETTAKAATSVEEAKSASERSIAETKAASEKALADAKAETEKLIAESKVAIEKAIADSEAKVAEANKAAEKAIADARNDAEARVAEANKATAEAKAKAAKLAYSEFSARYALLESRLRSKSISDEQYKSQLSDLRKELGL